MLFPKKFDFLAGVLSVCSVYYVDAFSIQPVDDSWDLPLPSYRLHLLFSQSRSFSSLPLSLYHQLSKLLSSHSILFSVYSSSLPHPPRHLLLFIQFIRKAVQTFRLCHFIIEKSYFVCTANRTN